MNIHKTLMFKVFLSTLFLVNLHAEKYSDYYGYPANMGTEIILHWSSPNVDWYLHYQGAREVGFNTTRDTVKKAFNRWEDVTTSDIDFTYKTSTTNTWGEDNTNVVYWAEKNDPAHDCPGGPLCDEERLAATVVWRNESGELTEADIIFDGFGWVWKVDGNDYDIETVAAHEIGHVQGLNETEVTGDCSDRPTMYANYFPCTTELRSLEFDDKVGTSFLYRGNLIDDEEFTYTDYYNWSLTVFSGKTLTVSPGATIKFANGKKLSVKGTLSAQGESQSPITFTRKGTSGSWYGIRFEDSSVDANCRIKYATIEHATYGIYCYKAKPRIENNTIKNNTYGIYINSESPSIETNEIKQNSYIGIRMSGSSAKPYIYDNLIRNNEYDGIQCYYLSAPSLFNNTIRYNGNDGVSAYYMSSPEFGPISGTDYGHNKIYSNSANGLYAHTYCSPFLGGGGGSRIGGGNSLYSNTSYNVKATNYTDVMAEYNWWGSSTPPTSKFYTDGTSSIDYTPYLISPVAQGSSLGKVLASSFPSESVDFDTNSVESLYYWGMQFWTTEELEKAIETYSILVRKFPNTPQARLGLIRLSYLYYEIGKVDLIDYLTNIIEENKDINLVKVAMDLLLDAYFQKEEFGNAIQTAEQIIGLLPSTVSEYLALFTLFNIYQHELKDVGKSEEVLAALKEKYPDYELTLIAQFEMGEEVDWSAMRFEVDEKPILAKRIMPPERYSLGINYPNPFNPITTIKYNLPDDSFIDLRIYDLLGREIRTLISGNEEAGDKSVIWDGKDSYGNAVSSGMYLYRLDAISNESDKEFHQTSKMVLLR